MHVKKEKKHLKKTLICIGNYLELMITKVIIINILEAQCMELVQE